ncbi:class I SAM-dependent methyltransferase [Achromobacter sp.]|uniref:class I SAM-dependent methyltransferase n=1 Tax=Achromobacter sp. TaxID=134375 RepID=UPI003C7863F3
MKQCLVCSAVFPREQPGCPSCHARPVLVDGFEAYAPELAREGGGFKESHFSELASLEEGHFWFEARNELIAWAIEKYCADRESFLEIGCGTGFVLSGMAKRFSFARLLGSEIFSQGLHFAAQRVPQASFIQMDARKIPFSEEFGVIGAFDVLEHIQEDEAVLRQVHQALKPEGMLLLTVPQHDWLWSPSDDYACHVRRYSARDCHAKLRSAGFHIVRSTSFVSLLLPLMMASRLKKRKQGGEFDVTDEFKLSPKLNSILYRVMKGEASLIKAGVDFAAGGSRFVIAQRIEKQ